MLASTIEMDPKVRIQGLLETTNRYLERARFAEAQVEFLRELTIQLKGFIEDIRGVVEILPADETSETLAVLIDAGLAELGYIPSRPAGAVEEETGGC